MMQSKRDYLVGLGLAKPGRGKFSNAAKEALAKAERDGLKFADGIPTKNSSPTEKPAKSVAGGQTETRTDPRDTAYLFPDEYRFPEAEYKAVGDDGKVYSMRECCSPCGVSLVNHACNTPVVHGSMPVTIKKVG